METKSFRQFPNKMLVSDALIRFFKNNGYRTRGYTHVRMKKF